MTVKTADDFRIALEAAREAARRRDRLARELRTLEERIAQTRARLAEAERELAEAQRAAGTATGEDADVKLAEVARLRPEVETLCDLLPRLEAQHADTARAHGEAMREAFLKADAATSRAFERPYAELVEHLAKDRTVRRLVARLHAIGALIPGAQVDLDEPLPEPSEAELEEARRWAERHLGELARLRRPGGTEAA